MGRKASPSPLLRTGNFVQEVHDLGKHWGCTIEEVPAYEDKAKPEDIPEELWDEKFKQNRRFVDLVFEPFQNGFVACN